MATDHDPVDWSVDEVVHFLCHLGSAPWAQSSNIPRPDPVKLEAALRENEMCGEVLMHVDNEFLKDLGVNAVGHRISLMKAVQWLQNKSSKYKLSHEDNNEADKPEINQQTHVGLSSSSNHVTPSPTAPTATNFITKAPSEPYVKDSDIVETGKMPKRRIAPTLVQPNDSEIYSRQALTSDSLPLPNGIFQPPETSHTSIDKDAPPGTRTQKEEDFLEYLIQRYPPHDDGDDGTASTPLPRYGESGSESELDSETWNEIAQENPSLVASGSSRLSRKDSESIIAQYITAKEDIWRQEHLPKELPRARDMWMYFRRSNNLEAEKGRLSANIEQLEARLNKFQDGILTVEFRSTQTLQRACGTLDMTVSDRCLAKWRLSILESDICPEKASRPAKAARPRVTREVEPGDDETLSSRSEIDFIAEDPLVDAADSEYSEIEEVDLGHESLSHVSVSSGNEDSLVQPKELPTRGLPFSLGSSPSSSTSGSPQPPRKRQRTIEADQSLTANPFGPTAFFPDDDKDLSDMDIEQRVDSATRPSSSLKSIQPHQDHDMDGILIKTPPLNPISPTDGRDGELMVTTPPLNPITPAKLTLTHPRRPDVHFDNPSANSRSSISQPIAISDSESDVSPAEENNPDIDPQYVELFESLDKTSFDAIMKRKDRIQLLAKSAMQLRSNETKAFGPFLNTWFPEVYAEQVQDAIRAMMMNKRELEGENKEEGRLSMRLGALFVSWFHCVSLDPQGIPPNLLREALDAIELDDKTMFDTFLQKFKELIDAYNKWNPNSSRRRSSGARSSDANSPVFGDDPFATHSHRPAAKPNHQKRKKRHIIKLQNKAQSFAQDRKAKQDRAREAFRRERDRLGLSNNDPAGQAVSFKEPIIYLNPLIGEFIKPHQLLGIQFMWRELCEADNPQGCLLAHVMGLGKTMQVIALLVTIAEAAASENPQVHAQVPSKFQRSQTLILCPSSLAPNWLEELDFWTPHDHRLGTFYDITPSVQPDYMSRLATLTAWENTGGILILSYDMFRRLVTPNRLNNFDEKQQKTVEDILLKTPNIVVADEAHRLKSDVSAISKLASSIKTTSRIAMTGSPLANNLMEYYQMIDWIAPGYLETPNAFKEKFIEPIQAGLYLDSTRSQRRSGLIALKLLNCIMEPKVNRAGISAIASDLPAKTEFILRIPLTELQQAAYNIFVDETKSKGNSNMLWHWLALMQLCCNHPVPFLNKLKDRTKQKDDADAGFFLPTSIAEADLPTTLFERIDTLFKTVPDLSDPNLSHRAVLLGRILEESQTVGDKVLIFSQSIPTVNYLDAFLKQRGWQYKRIDGSTATSARQGMVKKFNAGDGTQIMLISTRAGGLGLNMFGANRVVIFDFLFNPTWEEQAIGRAYRLGQKKPVFVYRFVASGTFEDVIHNKVVFKSQLSVRVVDKKNVLREGKKKNTEYLFPVKQKEKEALEHVLGKDPAVLDRIITSEDARSILGVTLSTLQDDENDRLTQQEHAEVQDKLSLDHLRRTDPQKYSLEIRKRELADQAAMEAVRLRFVGSTPYPTQTSVTNNPPQHNVVQSVPIQQRSPPQQSSLPQQFIPTQQPGLPTRYPDMSSPIPLDDIFLGCQKDILETQMRQAEIQTKAFRTQWEIWDLPRHQQHTNINNLDPTASLGVFMGYAEAGNPSQMSQPPMAYMSPHGTQNHASANFLQNLQHAAPNRATAPTEGYVPMAAPPSSVRPHYAGRAQSTESYVPPETMSGFGDPFLPTMNLSTSKQGHAERSMSFNTIASADSTMSMDISLPSEPPSPSSNGHPNQPPADTPEAQ